MSISKDENQDEIEDDLIEVLWKVNENMGLLKGHIRTVYYFYLVSMFIAILLSMVTLWWVLR